MQLDFKDGTGLKSVPGNIQCHNDMTKITGFLDAVLCHTALAACE